MSVVYTAPTITPSGASFAQLRSYGVPGLAALIAALNGLSSKTSSRINAGPAGASDCYRALTTAVDNYLHGDPASQADVLAIVADCAAYFRAVADAADEAGGLIAANPGTLTEVLPQPGDWIAVATPQRSFP